MKPILKKSKTESSLDPLLHPAFISSVSIRADLTMGLIVVGECKFGLTSTILNARMFDDLH